MLPARWVKLKPHAIQKAFMSSDARFNIVSSGRRSGKTELAKRRLVKKALMFDVAPHGWFVAAAPTHAQAKRIFWRDLKDLIPPEFIAAKPQESTLVIPLVNGAEIQVMGLDVPERSEGRPLDHIILDEYGNMAESTWTEHVRPALSNLGREGTADLIGVPEGRNHYYRIHQQVIQNKGAWAAFTWFSADILSPEEIAAAKSELDLRTFRQEYEGSFESFTGRVYYSFDSNIHAVPLRHLYDDRRDLILCFDFNVNPGTATILQELPVDHPFALRYSRKGLTLILDEVYVSTDSRTPIVVQKILNKWGGHTGKILCYGDASGGSRHSSQTVGSDWDQIREMLVKHFGRRVSLRIPMRNPQERPRVNAVNSHLQAVDGEVYMLIDRFHCSHTIADFEGVRVKEGSDGEIDKSDKKMTHLTDGLGYYVVSKFPVGQHQNRIQQIA